MKKLNKRKIRWIISEIKKGELSVYMTAKIQNITPQHARYVYKKYLGVANPILPLPGRKPVLFPREKERDHPVPEHLREDNTIEKAVV